MSIKSTPNSVQIASISSFGALKWDTWGWSAPVYVPREGILLGYDAIAKRSHTARPGFSFQLPGQWARAIFLQYSLHDNHWRFPILPTQDCTDHRHPKTAT